MYSYLVLYFHWLACRDQYQGISSRAFNQGIDTRTKGTLSWRPIPTIEYTHMNIQPARVLAPEIIEYQKELTQHGYARLTFCCVYYLNVGP